MLVFYSRKLCNQLIKFPYKVKTIHINIFSHLEFLPFSKLNYYAKILYVQVCIIFQIIILNGDESLE